MAGPRTCLNDLTAPSPATRMVFTRRSNTSKKVSILGGPATSNGKCLPSRTLGPRAKCKLRSLEAANLKAKIDGECSLFPQIRWLAQQPLAMDEDQRLAFEAMRDIPNYEHDATANEDSISHLMDGTLPFDLSHAGGEFQQILEDGLDSERR